MKIKQIIGNVWISIYANDQIRIDFWADYECEHCGHIEENRPGYDDSYFHRTVIPAMECPKCGKTAGDNYVPCETKYPDSAVV